MNITEVRVKRFDGESRLKGIAAITIDDCFVVHELKVIEGEKGLFVAMPSRKMPSGDYKDIAHPINQETRKMIEEIVIQEYHNTDLPE